MSDGKACACQGAPTLIFACSGAADVGEIADRTARKLLADGVGRMFCLAGIGGRVSGIVKTTEAAAKVLVIDGCPLACGRHTMQEAGLRKFQYLALQDLGMQKGQSPVTAERIEQAAEKARAVLAAPSVQDGATDSGCCQTRSPVGGEATTSTD